MEEKGAFHRGFRSRLLHFIYLLPILLGFRPLIIRFDLTVFILYSIGFLILLVMVIYSNSIPYVIYDKDGLYVLLEYREGREAHPYDQLLGYYRKKRRVLRIYSLEHKPLNLRIRKQEVERLIRLLESKGVSPVEREIARGKK